MCDALFFSVKLGISYKSGLCVMHCFFSVKLDISYKSGLCVMHCFFL